MFTARRVLGLGIVGLVTLLCAGPAFGYGGEHQVPAISVSSSVVAQGGSLTVQGVNFTTNAEAELTLHSSVVELGTVPTDADGQFSVQVTIPADVPPGQHTIEALDLPTGSIAAASITVTAVVPPVSRPPVSPPPVAGTGVAIAGLAGLGLVLVACGQALVVAGRRRRVARV